MPATANYRRTTAAMPLDGPEMVTAAPRRAVNGRAVRANTTRPANYYARPYGSMASAGALSIADAYKSNLEPGFFPALQFFSDAVTALPKEVVRQFTLMKEVEAKIHERNEKIGELIDALLELPVPPSKNTLDSAITAVGGQHNAAILSLTANNSIAGSTTTSVVNGTAPSAGDPGSAANSIAGSINGDGSVKPETEEDMGRRKRYYELRMMAHNLLPNLDEKNVVLAEANRVMDVQLTRIDSVLPHIDNEISEDARLGSMIHWAYSDNRQKKQASSSGAHSRAVQATNALASVANAFHEAEIFQARREAGREATKEKQKARMREHVDPDFDDRPKKSQKVSRPKPSAAVPGLGISTGAEGAKRRKVEKGLSSAMERSASSKGAKGGRESPRSTPAVDLPKKPKNRPVSLPKKKLPTSNSNSPALASSPLHNSFNPATATEPPSSSARPQSARIRQNSTSNLRHEKLADHDASRPSSAAGKTNGNSTSKATGRKKNQEDGDDRMDIQSEMVQKTTEMDGIVKADDLVDNEIRNGSQSRSHSAREDRGSKHGTPRVDTTAEISSMARTRSTRSMRGNGGGHESSSSEPQQQGPSSKHRRALSNSHLVRQLAPYNRSPDMDRHHSLHEGDDDDVDVDSVDTRERQDVEMEAAHVPALEERRSERRPLSRRNTGSNLLPSSSAVSENAADDEDDTLVEYHQEPPVTEPDLVPDAAEGEFEEEDSDHDPDDPNEPRYCYCNRGSYGEMVACDNENCPREWFHLGCTELTDTPPEEETWYCAECRPKFERKRIGRAGRGRT